MWDERLLKLTRGSLVGEIVIIHFIMWFFKLWICSQLLEVHSLVHSRQFDKYFSVNARLISDHNFGRISLKEGAELSWSWGYSLLLVPMRQPLWALGSRTHGTEKGLDERLRLHVDLQPHLQEAAVTSSLQSSPQSIQLILTMFH